MATQLVAPNPNIPCTPGWCLQYVRQTFGLPARYGSATEAWNNSPSQHRDRNFPASVWLPLWFAIDVEPDGHVALRRPDGKIYSSSDNTNVPHLHDSIDELISYYAYWGKMTLTYLGWTEDVAGYPVISLDSGTINVDSIPSAPSDPLEAIMTDPAGFIQQLLDTQVDGSDGNKATLRSLLSEYRQQHNDEIRVTNRVPDTIFNTEIDRGGQMGGKTSLGAMIGWNDEHVIQQLAATAAAAASNGASVEQIKQAVTEAMQAGLKVTISTPDQA